MTDYLKVKLLSFQFLLY